MIRENEMIMISEAEYQEHLDEEFNNGWNEFKHLVIDNLANSLIESVEELC